MTPYKELQTLRSEDPVVWAILTGKGTSHTIAAHLVMNLSNVEDRLDQLLEEGVVYRRNYMGRAIFRLYGPHYRGLAKYVRDFREML